MHICAVSYGFCAVLYLTEEVGWGRGRRCWSEEDLGVPFFVQKDVLTTWECSAESDCLLMLARCYRPGRVGGGRGWGAALGTGVRLEWCHPSPFCPNGSVNLRYTGWLASAARARS